MQALLALRPALTVPGIDALMRCEMGGGDQQWRYDGPVASLRRLLAQPPWRYPRYQPAQAAAVAQRLRADPAWTPTMDELRSVFTWALRGDRFAPGHFATCVRDGVLLAAIEAVARIAVTDRSSRT